MDWDVASTDEFDVWFDALDEKTQGRLSGFISHLRERGPHLGHPQAKRIEHCPSMRLYELRPTVKGREFRILYAFVARQAVLLHGGDKTGEWNKWYPPAIAAAETLLQNFEQQTEG